MHGRQHTGVSIYEARTERTPLPPLPRRKMREAAGVTEKDGNRNSRWREGDKTERWIRERKRYEGPKEKASTRERESSTTIGTVFRVPHPSSPCQNPYLPPPDANLSLRAKQTSLLLAFLATSLFANFLLPSPRSPRGRILSVYDGSWSPLGSRLRPVAPWPMYTGQHRALNM